MKALSLWQPWASLMAAGIKTIETRGWSTVYRGPLAIHAAKRPMRNEERTLLFKWAARGLLDHKNWTNSLPPELFPYGVIIAVVDLINCLPTAYIADSNLSSRQKEFGDFSNGRWAWFTIMPRAINPPIPYRGQQGLFEIPDSIVNQVSI